MIEKNHNTARDWPEDFHHENGSYSNKCVICKHTFMGYKRRVVCKLCDTPENEAEK